MRKLQKVKTNTLKTNKLQIQKRCKVKNTQNTTEVLQACRGSTTRERETGRETVLRWGEKWSNAIDAKRVPLSATV